MTHETSVGYYNNTEKKPVRRLAAQLLENCHFTKSIALRMAPFERGKVVVYCTLWCICWLQPNADIGLISASTQAVFTEQIISRAWRLEWLRSTSERIFDEVRQSFSSGATGDQFLASTLRSFTDYETCKATAGITLSSAIFHRENAKLSAEWDSIKKGLGL